MDRYEILSFISAVLGGEVPEFIKTPKLFVVRNPQYDPDIEGSYPSLTIRMDVLKNILEKYMTRQ